MAASFLFKPILNQVWVSGNNVLNESTLRLEKPRKFNDADKSEHGKSAGIDNILSHRLSELSLYSIT
ncbi:hypothetical protein [Massilia horti]|uniref:Uncharacterized protein n=1 Tax=Massilia horti TaxID=2562153 RepID=A0A4Y9SQ87_9BURK|nr:hypothetical protein [Massilia horti]TFW27519.1 hypothetical protein E4O92_23730 [Massilia horti]